VPTFSGVTGQVYYKAWRVPAPSAATVVFLHGFGEHSGLYHRYGNALNNAGIDLWALDEIGHGLTDGDRAVIGSIDDLVENGRRLTAIAEEAQPGRPAWLAGHSLGAAAAAVSAARDPGRYAGLILSGTPLACPVIPSTWMSWPTIRWRSPARPAPAAWRPYSRRPGMSWRPASGRWRCPSCSCTARMTR
jgi:alpha-beta hydrolase superfamily lysophospholipase